MKNIFSLTFVILISSTICAMDNNKENRDPKKITFWNLVQKKEESGAIKLTPLTTKPGRTFEELRITKPQEVIRENKELEITKMFDINDKFYDTSLVELLSKLKAIDPTNLDNVFNQYKITSVNFDEKKFTKNNAIRSSNFKSNLGYLLTATAAMNITGKQFNGVFDVYASEPFFDATLGNQFGKDVCINNKHTNVNGQFAIVVSDLTEIDEA